MSMDGNRYDAIVVGARCAGSPTAMLLARKGYRVLVVDRATFPSDTLSTHIVHPPGGASLRRWGLLDRVTATGCPPIHTYAFDDRAPTTRPPAPAGGRPRQPGRDGWLRPGHRRRDLTRRLLLRGQRRAHPGPGGGRDARLSSQDR